VVGREERGDWVGGGWGRMEEGVGISGWRCARGVFARSGRAHLLDDLLELLLPVDAFQPLVLLEVYCRPDRRELLLELLQPVRHRVASLALRPPGPVRLAQNCSAHEESVSSCF